MGYLLTIYSYINSLIIHIFMSIVGCLFVQQSENAGNSLLTCKLCDSTFDSCEGLRSHRLQAHRCRDQRVMVNTSGGAVSAGSLTCNICSKVFTYPSQLRDHAMKHEGRRPFMCTECGMDFMKVCRICLRNFYLFQG